MKTNTITLQGTKEQISKVQLNSYAFPTEELPIVVETRVYVVKNIDSIGLMSDILIDDKHYTDLTDEEFMTLAEEDGTVYTIQGFQEAFNNEEINSAIDVIRFISVPCN